MRTPIVVTVFALLLAGCSGGTTSTSGGSGGAVRDNALTAKGPAPSRSNTKSADLLDTTVRGHDVVYTGSLTVRARDLNSALADVEGIVARVGGLIADERTSTGPDHGSPARATLTLRVPPEDFRTVLNELGSTLGTQLDRRQQIVDVTERVADVESRVQSARAALVRLRALYDKAQTIEEMLAIEAEITERQADLEAVQAQRKALAAQTEFATITLELVERAAAPPSPTSPKGFVAGLAMGWKAFVAFGTNVSTFLGMAFPFLVPLGLLGLATWWARGLVRRHRPTPPPATP